MEDTAHTHVEVDERTEGVAEDALEAGQPVEETGDIPAADVVRDMAGMVSTRTRSSENMESTIGVNHNKLARSCVNALSRENLGLREVNAQERR